MKSAVFFILSFSIALVLLCAYERDRRSIELQLTNLTSKLESPIHDTEHLAAMLVSTNLVHRPCPCGFCRPSEGISVPEHINALGYDTVMQVSTNYLPVVIYPKPSIPPHEPRHNTPSSTPPRLSPSLFR